MKTILRGHIVGYIPSVSSQIANGKLVLGESGNIEMTIDSGFSGGIALPHDILQALDKKRMGYDFFTLATGERVKLPTYRGTVIVNQKEIAASIIPGDKLIGMEFLSSVGTILSFHLKHQTVRLAK